MQEGRSTWENADDAIKDVNKQDARGEIGSNFCISGMLGYLSANSKCITMTLKQKHLLKILTISAAIRKISLSRSM